MKYFLDSAILDEIKQAHDDFILDGITTNPKHIMNSGKTFNKAIEDIAKWADDQGYKSWEDFPISVEINPYLVNPDEMVQMAKDISSVSPCFVIKIPSIYPGIQAAKRLETEGVRTNLTLVFSAAQAIMPAKLGCLFVSPFIGWKETNGEDCRQYIKDIVDMYKNYGYYGKTQIICAAIRTPKQFVDCAVAGADIVTAGLQVYLDSFAHPYTRQGLETFQSAWDNTKKDPRAKGYNK